MPKYFLLRNSSTKITELNGLLEKKVQILLLILCLIIWVDINRELPSNPKDNILFFQKIQPITLNLTLKVIFEQLELDKVKHKNEMLYQNELSAIKNTINLVYLKEEIPNQFCKRVPDTLKGFLNSTIILKNANLSNLVQFYDEKNKNKTLTQNKELIEKSKDKKAFIRDLFYLNGTEYKKNDSSIPEENWLLWNSNNMSGLLNMSQSFFGEDGHRVELGK